MHYDIHPAAALFPLMPAEELKALANDIERNGLLEPIVLYQGQILDGRNRQAACEIAGVAPKFIDGNGNIPSPTLYVLSKNLHRRHLTPSQRAAIAAEGVDLLREEKHNSSLANLKRGETSPMVPTGTIGGRSREIMAKALGVGATSVSRAIKVKEKSPELFQKMKTGQVSGFAAERTVDGKEPKGKTFVVTTERSRTYAESYKRKMITALSTITGLCRGLDELNVDGAISVCSNDDLKLWSNRSRELANKLRKFAARLERSTNADSSQA